MPRFVATVGLLLVLLSAAPTPGVAETPADLVIRNAKVIDLATDDARPGSVAIVGDRIVSVGTDAALADRVGPNTKVIDAGGRALLPGLYDSHVHPLGASSSEKDHPIPAFTSIEAIRAYIRERTKALPRGSWIIVRYAFPTRLSESRFLTRAELDAVAPDHPVLHQGGPAGVANSKALALSGVTRDTPDPPAGQIVKDPATGEPTGMLRNAYSVLKGLPRDAYSGSSAEETNLVKDLFRRYNARGLTSIGDRSASESALRLYRGLRDRGELTVPSMRPAC
ncbi:MAG: amidohydrolase family protein [Isosphaeraceae bacterium]